MSFDPEEDEGQIVVGRRSGSEKTFFERKKLKDIGIDPDDPLLATRSRMRRPFLPHTR